MHNYQSESFSHVHPHPVTRAPLLLSICFSLHFVALIFVSLRILVKSKLGKLGMEDVLIVISAVCFPPLPPSCITEKRQHSPNIAIGNDAGTPCHHLRRYVTLRSPAIPTAPISPC